MIEPIYASSDKKDDVYRLLSMVHAMAGQCATKGHVCGWELKETATYPDYVKTVWTNGIVDVAAVTNPLLEHHQYSMKSVVVEEE